MSCAIAYLYYASKPVMFSGNLQFLALRSLKEKKASCINSVLTFLTLTSNEEGSRFWYKNHTVSLEKYWLTFVKPLYFPVEEGSSYE